MKKRIKELVREHLILINQPDLKSARVNLHPEHWQSFWEVIAQRYIDEQFALVEGTIEVNNFAPDQIFKETWDCLEALYPEYILEPPSCIKY